MRTFLRPYAPFVKLCDRLANIKYSNPELVKAVEELLGNPTEQQKTETTPNVEDKKADIERRRPTSYIENPTDKQLESRIRKRKAAKDNRSHKAGCRK